MENAIVGERGGERKARGERELWGDKQRQGKEEMREREKERCTVRIVVKKNLQLLTFYKKRFPPCRLRLHLHL